MIGRIVDEVSGVTIFHFIGAPNHKYFISIEQELLINYSLAQLLWYSEGAAHPNHQFLAF